MLSTLYRSFILILFISGCATLDIQEIQNLKREKFEALSFNPSYEPNNLRIDIIRRTTTDSYGDSTGSYLETRSVPYHPMGFDLGNRLFFDLNKNLSLRIDSILEIRNTGDFTISVANYHGTGRRSVMYQFNNDSLTVSYPPRDKKHFRYVVTGNRDSLRYHWKGRRDYSIKRENEREIYQSGKRPKIISYQPSTGDYLLVYKKRKKRYHSTGNELYLEKYYRVRINNDHTLIEIRKGRGNHRIIYSMIRSKECLYIFDKGFHGLKINRNDTLIELYRNKKLLTGFTVCR